MLIAYASRTGNVARFVEKLPYQNRLRILTGTEQVDEPCIVITYTTGFGEVPKEVLEFARRNRAYIRGVASSGNRNWGANFAKAGVVLSQQLGVPLLHQFELAGWEKDVETLARAVARLEASQAIQSLPYAVHPNSVQEVAYRAVS
ncbi:MAG: class Ib ribonucleoside-diphosphate reductase assembly flavoprotein NrdI [Fimbriimonadales bacterium]